MLAPARKSQHTTCCCHINAKHPAPITISAPPTAYRVDCNLFSCFILLLCRFLVIAQHIDVFIVGFHKVALTRNLLNSLRIAFQLAKSFCVGAVAFVIFLYLFFLVAYLNFVLQTVHKAVIVDENKDKHAHHHYDKVAIMVKHSAHFIPFAVH